jgi:hypothetical protein
LTTDLGDVVEACGYDPFGKLLGDAAHVVLTVLSTAEVSVGAQHGFDPAGGDDVL